MVDGRFLDLEKLKRLLPKMLSSDLLMWIMKFYILLLNFHCGYIILLVERLCRMTTYWVLDSYPLLCSFLVFLARRWDNDYNCFLDITEICSWHLWGCILVCTGHTVGYRKRAGSVSPVRHRDERRRFSPGSDHSGGAPQSSGLGRGRDSTRRRDYSPHNGRGRFAGRGYHRSARGPGPFKVDDPPRNNPNVRPREGDWICSVPSCKNLNFARREHCFSCNKPRHSLSPRRGYPGPASRRFSSPPLDRSPQRIMKGRYRSPPRPLSRDAPRDLRASGPPLRHNGRFPQDYAEDDSRDRYKFGKPMPFDHRDRGRDNYNGRRDYGRRAVSPELPPPRGWAPHSRERSRSPVRGGAPPKDYRRDMYSNRGRGGRRGGFGR